MDGSFHDWLEGRGPRGCLMDMVDDATGTGEARMGKEETIWAAAQAEDYHGRKPSVRELDQIFRLETERAVSNDWVIRHQGRWFQLHPGQRRYGPTRSKALLCEWEDGTLEVHYRGKAMAFTELPGPIQRPSAHLWRLFFTLPYRRIILSPLVPSLRSRLRPSGYSNMEDAMRVSLIILSLVLAFAAIRASAEPAAKKETKWQGNVVRIYKDQSQMDMRGGGTGQSSDLKEGRLR
jgi:hypothetical protein